MNEVKKGHYVLHNNRNESERFPMCLTLVTASIMNTTLVRCKEIERQYIITVNTRVLNDPLTQVHVCWSNKSPKCVLSYEYILLTCYPK